MSFVRPEARATLWKWREALTGVALCGLGTWAVLGSFGLMQVVGFALAAAGVFLVLLGLQRGRFRAAKGGPGVVQTIEGAVTYYGPLNGGSVALRELTSLTLDTSGHPAHYVLTQPGQPELYIPVNAEGADALFDAFTSLPGFPMQYLLGQLDRTPDHPVVIWQKRTVRLH